LVGDAGIVNLSLTQQMNLLNVALRVKKEITIYFVKALEATSSSCGFSPCILLSLFSL